MRAPYFSTMGGARTTSMKEYLLARLHETKKAVPEELRARLLAHGSELVPELLAIVRDADMNRGGPGLDDEPRGGWPLLHAVNLLGELRVVEAIEPLLDLMERANGELVEAWITLDLPQIGAPVLDAAIPRRERCEDLTLRETYTFLIAGVQLPHPYIWEMLCTAFAADEIQGAILFAHHGDPRALPLLEAALRRIQAMGYCDGVHYELGELLTSYEDLGGTLPDDLAEYVRDAYEEWERREPSLRG